MTKSKFTSPTQYLDSLPADRKKILSRLRGVIKKNLDKGFKETINWGMITYEVPLKTYPETYNKQPLAFAAIAAQKNHLALYMPCSTMSKKDDQWLRDQFKKRGLKLDMGKSCIRFNRIEDLPLDVIGKLIKAYTVKKFIAVYEEARK